MATFFQVRYVSFQDFFFFFFFFFKVFFVFLSKLKQVSCRQSYDRLKGGYGWIRVYRNQQYVLGKKKKKKKKKKSLTNLLFLELTEQSDSACTSVLDYTLKKLRSKSARVKHKALLVLKNCIERGHPTFRTELVLRSEEVRSELQFSGPPDPMEGDAPYRRVREEADRVLNMMYDETSRKVDVTKRHEQTSMEGGQDEGPPPPPSFLPTRPPEGYGTGGGGGGGGGMKRYEGMGNWTPPAEDSTWYGKAATAVASATSTVVEKGAALVGVKTQSGVDWNDKEIYTRQASLGMGGGGGTYQGPTASGPGIKGLSTQQTSLFEKKKKKNRRKQGEVGGTAWQQDEEEEEEDEPEEKKGFDYSTVKAQQEQVLSGQPITQNNNNNNNNSEGGGGADAKEDEELEGDISGTFEWRLVDELCRPVGLRSHPTQEELEQFCQKVESLRWKTVCEALNGKVDDDVWQVRLKALCAIGEMLERKRPSGAKRYFKKHPDSILAETQSGNKAIRQKAQQVAQLVFQDKPVPQPRRAAKVVAESSSSSSHSHQQHQHQQHHHQQAKPSGGATSNQSGNMLSFLDEPVAPVVTAGGGGSGGLLSPASPAPANSLSTLNLSAPVLQQGPTLQPYYTPPQAQPTMMMGQPQAPVSMMGMQQQQHQQPMMMGGGPVVVQQPMMMGGVGGGPVVVQQPMMMGQQPVYYGQMPIQGGGMVAQPMYYQQPQQQQQQQQRMQQQPVSVSPSRPAGGGGNDSFSFVQDAMKKQAK